jgi:hypothetical protein
MENFKRTIIAINFYTSFIILGTILGAVSSYLLVGTVYIAIYPGPVTNSTECAHGMFAGLAGLVGGALAGSSIAGYAVSRFLFREAPLRTLETEIAYSLIKLEWDTRLGKHFRAATHYVCSGAAVVAFAGIADPVTASFILPLGFMAVITGGITFVRAPMLSAQDPGE